VLQYKVILNVYMYLWVLSPYRNSEFVFVTPKIY